MQTQILPSGVVAGSTVMLALAVLTAHGCLEGWPFVCTTKCRRSRSAGCKSNLKALVTAERAFFREQDRYSSHLDEIGAGFERGNRYAYFLGSGPVEDRSGPTIATPEGVGAIGSSTARAQASTSRCSPR